MAADDEVVREADGSTTVVVSDNCGGTARHIEPMEECVDGKAKAKEENAVSKYFQSSK